jgi:hypothetical protein
LAGYEHHIDRSNPRRHLAPVSDRAGRVTGAGVRPGEPQVFDSLTVSCHGCGRAIPPGVVFTRYPTPDDRRRDLTSPFCQTCRPIGPPEPAAQPSTTQDLLSALRRGLERQAQTESGTEG